MRYVINPLIYDSHNNSIHHTIINEGKIPFDLISSIFIYGEIMLKGSSLRGLRIIIVGCGKVGRTLVEQLGKEGHDITIVDKNRERISQVSNIYDVMGIAGNGASYKILQEAGIDDADLIIAVTGSDELNLLCCTIATQVGNCAAIARVRTPEYSQEAKYLRDKLGLASLSTLSLRQLLR